MNEQIDEERRVRVTTRAAKAGATVASASFRTALDIETKSQPIDYVTRADRNAQQAVVEKIRETYPAEPIIGEEDEDRNPIPDRGPAWIVDPIDGTTNFVRGSPIYATAVACVYDGKPIASAIVLPEPGDTCVAGLTEVTINGEPVTVSETVDPAESLVGQTLWWDVDERSGFVETTRSIVTRFADIRRIGSAQALLAQVGIGILDGIVAPVEAYPWDTVAGVHMIRTAGGTVTDVSGAHWEYDSTGLVASNGHLHDELLDAAQDAVNG